MDDGLCEFPVEIVEGPVTGDDAERLATGELGAGRLAVDLAVGEFDKRVVELFRRNRQMLEDSGTSALFLSLGMLQWFEAPQSQQARLAPILLVPVTLERRAVGGPYHLVRSEEDTMVNTTLLKKLEADFGLTIPGLGAELATDDWGVTSMAGIIALRRPTPVLWVGNDRKAVISDPQNGARSAPPPSGLRPRGQAVGSPGPGRW